MPFHWGFAGETVGAIANDLTSIVGDPNVSMHEAKAFTVNVRASRLENAAGMQPDQPMPWPTREPAPDTKIGSAGSTVACKQWNQLPADGFHWTGL